MINYHNSTIEANANRAAKMADAENHRLAQDAQTSENGHKSVARLLLVTATRVATLVATR